MYTLEQKQTNNNNSICHFAEKETQQFNLDFFSAYWG